MSFNLTPASYLALAREEYAEFVQDVGSIRRAMTSCILINHVVDHVLAHYYPTDPAKLRLPAGLNEIAADEGVSPAGRRRMPAGRADP
jgi:hypothetical protein